MRKQKDSIDQKIEYLDRLHKAMNKIKAHYAYQHNESSIAGLRTITNGVRDEIIELQARYNLIRRNIALQAKKELIILMDTLEREVIDGWITKKDLEKEIETLRYCIGSPLDRKKENKKTTDGDRKKGGSDKSGDRKGPFQQ